MSIDQVFEPRSNSFNGIRLALASLVIVAHSYPLGGFRGDPSLGGIDLGTFAVAGFFTISGFLITRSRLRTPGLTYLQHRFLRIFPGFWVCLLVTAFIAAPLATLHAGAWSVSGAVNYLTGNFLLHQHVLRVDQTPNGVPFSVAWNGSLWTLSFEFACYLLVGIVVLSKRLTRERRVFIWLFLAASLLGVLRDVSPRLATDHIELSDFSLLAPYFFAGALVFVYADKIPFDWRIAAAASGLTVVVAWSGHGLAVAPLPLAYVFIWLGVVLPPAFRRIGSRNDISYGIYIYAFPVQQLLAGAGLQSSGVAVFAVVSIVCTIPLAVGSWVLVERPALRLKRARDRPLAKAPALT